MSEQVSYEVNEENLWRAETPGPEGWQRTARITDSLNFIEARFYRNRFTCGVIRVVLTDRLHGIREFRPFVVRRDTGQRFAFARQIG